MRYRQHIANLCGSNPDKGSWIKELEDQGLKPSLEVLEVCDSGHIRGEVERELIDHFRTWGEADLNIRSGGGGAGRARPLDYELGEWVHLFQNIKAAENILTVIHNDICRLAKKPYAEKIYASQKKITSAMLQLESFVFDRRPEWLEEIRRAPAGMGFQSCMDNSAKGGRSAKTTEQSERAEMLNKTWVGDIPNALQFINEELDVGSSVRSAKSEVYESYTKWCELKDVVPVSRVRFSKHLRAAKPFVREIRPKPSPEGSRPRIWVGIRPKRTRDHGGREYKGHRELELTL
jgi:hypothetical protein